MSEQQFESRHIGWFRLVVGAVLFAGGVAIAWYGPGGTISGVMSGVGVYMLCDSWRKVHHQTYEGGGERATHSSVIPFIVEIVLAIVVGLWMAT